MQETDDKQTSDDDAIQHFLRGAAAARNFGLLENVLAGEVDDLFWGRGMMDQCNQ